MRRSESYLTWLSHGTLGVTDNLNRLWRPAHPFLCTYENKSTFLTSCFSPDLLQIYLPRLYEDSLTSPPFELLYIIVQDVFSMARNAAFYLTQNSKQAYPGSHVLYNCSSRVSQDWMSDVIATADRLQPHDQRGRFPLFTLSHSSSEFSLRDSRNF